MLRKLSITFISILLVLMGIRPSLADTIMENIALTGTLTVGTSFDLVPYAYFNEKEELDGYSIDILRQIQAELEKQLNKPITLDFVETNSFVEAIPKITSGEIDIACNVTFTWERDDFVDYTVRYTTSSIRILVPKGSSLGTANSLVRKKIGIPPATFVEDVIKRVHPQSILVPQKNVKQGILALQTGQIDALAGDAIILDGIRQEIDPDRYEIFPKFPEAPYARYGVGCIVPESNSTFLNIANYSIIKLMQGYLIGEEPASKIVNRWFGPEGVITVNDTNIIKEFFEYTIMLHEQIPLSEPK